MSGIGKRSATGIILLFCLFWSAAAAQAHTPQDELLPDVGVDEQPGAQLPLDLSFTDQGGKSVRLGTYFAGGPVILTLNYYACPELCPIIFKNLSNTVNGMKGLSLERDFRIVTVSINPEETVAAAHAKSAEAYRMLRGVAGLGERWPFLLGREADIRKLTKAVGVRYTRLEKNNFAHPSVFVVLTPEGRVSRYLYGLEHSPTDLKLALIEAAAGRIGGSTLLNRVLLYCYHYDPVGRKYAVAAINVMKIAGGVVVLLLGVLLLALWRREGKQGAGTGGGEPGGGS